MFTGIVTSLGRVRDVTGTDIVRFELTAPFPAAGIDMGASIAHAGVCLTVVDKGELDKGCWYAVEVSPETLRLTTLGDWR
jgi:riboflavin synthase